MPLSFDLACLVALCSQVTSSKERLEVLFLQTKGVGNLAGDPGGVTYFGNEIYFESSPFFISKLNLALLSSLWKTSLQYFFVSKAQRLTALTQ